MSRNIVERIWSRSPVPSGTISRKSCPDGYVYTIRKGREFYPDLTVSQAIKACDVLGRKWSTALSEVIATGDVSYTTIAVE